jgi:hypothetical protein
MENISRRDPHLGTAYDSHVPSGSFRTPTDTQCSTVISSLAWFAFRVDVVYLVQHSGDWPMRAHGGHGCSV